MIDALVVVFTGLALMSLVGALIVAYVVWRSNRRMDDAAAEMAREAEK
jgi:uncharacterized membrane protein YqjE